MSFVPKNDSKLDLLRININYAEPATGWVLFIYLFEKGELGIRPASLDHVSLESAVEGQK